MNASDFDYELPAERIAQHPPARRDDSRLFVLHRTGGAAAHHVFSELPELLAPGDLVVVNDTRVIPARLAGTKVSGGRVELLLLERLAGSGASERWRVLLRAARPPRPGSRLALEGGLAAEVAGREVEGWIVDLSAATGTVGEAIERGGRMPLPPYVRRDAGAGAGADPREHADDAEDRERYQTVWAERPGAVAAPTAGLHFTHELIGRLAARGIDLVRVTLHVGAGTFLPVRVERLEDHRLHEERFEIGAEAARALAAARGRVVAVGTTVVRTLEQAALLDGIVREGSGRTRLFIHPGFRFRVVDALITNFHLPRSTLLMLVAAFAGREQVLAAYSEAVRRDYRFYSYGDAMLILP